MEPRDATAPDGSRITLRFKRASKHARPHARSLLLALPLYLATFFVSPSIASAAGHMASMPGSTTLPIDTPTPAQATSSFSTMANMAAQGSLEDGPDPSSGRSSISDLISVTPRVWITHVNPTESSGFDSSAVLVPMYGGSITITPPSAPDFSIVATAFYGKGEGEAFGRDADVLDGDSEITRTDIELLLRYRIPETQLIVFGGPRYVTYDQNFEFDSFDVDTTSKIWIVEAGIGAFGDITESGRHRFFGNLTLGLAFDTFESKTDRDLSFDGKEDQTTGTVDVNLGYQYLIADWVSFNFRYRMFTIFTEDDFEQSDLTTIHGPELGLALRF